METGRKSGFNASINMVPFVALSFSMAVFAIIAILLMVSMNSLKSDNAALKSQLETMQQELVTLQNASVMNESQEDAFTAGMADIQARVEALEALKKQMEQSSAQAADPGLKVASFDLQFISNPAYAYQTYSGAGTLTAADASKSYLVLLQKTLKAGGAPTTKKMEYVLVLVVGGTGTFYTDDSAEGTVQKPEYEFSVVGSVRIETQAGQ